MYPHSLRNNLTNQILYQALFNCEVVNRLEWMDTLCISECKNNIPSKLC